MTEETKVVEKKGEESTVEPEIAEINAYLDGDAADADGEKLTERERLDYLKARYQQVKDEYKLLRLQNEELEGRKDSDALARLTHSAKLNWKARRWVVIQLRCAGEVVSDPFVPKSATK